MARMAPKPSTISKLLALSGGVCTYRGCQTSLVQEGVFNATLAHIRAASPNGPRYDTSMTDEARRAFENLMYMCPNHGSIIDKDKLHAKYSVTVLQEMKADHEREHIGKPYQAEDDVFDDAIEEARIIAIQANTINGDSNMQINNQVIFAAGEQVSESANEILKHLNDVKPKAEQTDDEDEPPEDPGGTAAPTNLPNAPSGLSRRTEELDGETPGTIDSIATAEKLTPQWTQTINDINTEIVSIGEYTDESASILTAQSRRNASMSAKIPVFKQLAKRLTIPADRIEDLTSQFMLQLKEIDPGMKAMIQLATENGLQNAENKIAAQTLYNSVEELVNSSISGFSSLRQMLEATQPIEIMSKDLRRPLLKIRRSLERMLESRNIFEEWLEIVETSKSKLQT